MFFLETDCFRLHYLYFSNLISANGLMDLQISNNLLKGLKAQESTDKAYFGHFRMSQDHSFFAISNCFRFLTIYDNLQL